METFEDVECVCKHVQKEHAGFSGTGPITFCMVIIDPAGLEEQELYCQCGQYTPKRETKNSAEGQ